MKILLWYSDDFAINDEVTEDLDLNFSFDHKHKFDNGSGKAKSEFRAIGRCYEEDGVKIIQLGFRGTESDW